ncbi:MAG: ADOP family duplicated permease [Vicinamibacterales bacterium]
MWHRTLRPVLRRLVRDRGYAAAFVLTLGLGIGATTAIFSNVEAVLIRPLPYPNADRIMWVEQPLTRLGRDNALFSFAEVADYRTQASTIDQLVEYGDWQFSVVGSGDPLLAYGGLVTSNYFTLLNIHAAIGRTLQGPDDVRGAAPVAVLTHEFWRRAFGEDPSVVGRVIELTGVATTIVGVLEPGSHYAGTERPELYANYSTNAHYMSASMQDERTHRMTSVYALLRRGVPVEAARSDLRDVARRLHAAYPTAYPAASGFDVRLTPWRDVLVREARPTLLILMGAVVLVLVVACANVGNLSLARLVRRERELAVRTALGASARQLRFELFVEHLGLAVAGAVAGVVVAWAAQGQLTAYAARMTLRAEEVRLNPTVLGFALAVGIGIALVFAWAPRLPAAAPALAGAATGGRTTVGRGQRRAQRLLVGAQVAVSFVVLVGAGLLGRSLLNLERVDTGFDATSILALKAPNFTRADATRNRALFDQLTARLAAFPGVEAVATASSAPYDTMTVYTWDVAVQGRSPEQLDAPLQLITQVVSPSYFDTLDVAIRRGRGFTIEDAPGAPPALVINERLAQLIFGADDPIGRRVRWAFAGSNSWNAWHTVVGVARDARELGPQAPPVATVYESALQASPGPAVLVRTTGDPMATAREAARLVHEMDPKRPVTDVWTLDEALGERVAPARLNAGLFGALALLAVAIAAVGLAGVLAFAVSERTREFGIRMALGAAPGRILRGILGEGLLLAAGGVAAGLAGALLLSRSVREILFEVDPADPATLVLAGLAVAAITTAAAWLPARRATRVDPNVALRTD